MTSRIVMAGAVVAWLALLRLANDYVLTVLVLAGIYAIIAVGLNIFTGYTGQISFGHNAFAAIGGYTSAILTTDPCWPPRAALLCRGILPAVAASLGRSAPVHLPSACPAPG